MGFVNRVINILVLLFAIVAVVFAFVLFNKREKLVKGWDDMAATIGMTAKTLDANSGTKLASSLDSKKLDHTQFDNLGKALPELNKGAANLVKERDALAEGIKDIASKLEIPVTDEDAKALKEVASSDAKKDDIKAKVSKIQDRNQGIINEVIASARKVDLNIDEAALKDTENFRDPLSKFNGKVEGVKKRNDAYGTFISQMASILGGSKPNLAGDDYARSLTDAASFVTSYKNTFENTKRKLASEKTRSTELKEQLDGKETELAKLSDDIKKKESEIAKLNNLINPEGKEGEIKIVNAGDPAALKMIKGQVVDINAKWDFVVINVGAKTQVIQKIGVKENTIAAPLPADKNMTVARGLSENPAFIGKIKITKVYDDCAIANVIPSPKGKDSIQVGDVVFFSDEDLAVPEEKKAVKVEKAEKAEKTDK